MNRTPVASSSMASAGYDPATLTMEIEFKDGAIYQYFDVPEHIYHGLVSAQSIGQYFQAQVRGSYRYARA